MYQFLFSLFLENGYIEVEKVETLVKKEIMCFLYEILDTLNVGRRKT